MRKLPYQKVSIDYFNDDLMKNEVYRNDLLMRIAAVGKRVEADMANGGQDIEGVVECGSDKIWVVQSRPQV